MLNVLIVEDEEWIRRGIIKEVEWNRLELQLAGEAENGQQAIEILEKASVDILITDMKMPVCDGKELLIEIEKRGLSCEIIVLSEYTDFEYTRQAIHAKVADYLLKPIDPLILNKQLSLASQRITTRRMHEKIEDPLEKLFQATITHIAQGLSANLVFPESSIIVACLQLENLFDADTERLFNEKISTPPYATKILSYPGNRHIACLFSVLPAKITIVNSTEYGKWIRDIFAYFSNNHFRLRIGVGKVANSLDSLQESFDESLLALQYFQYGKGSILWYERISKNSNPEKAHINHIGESQIVEFLRKGKKEGIERFCRTMLRSFRDAELLYIPAMRSCILDFTLTVERCSGKAGYSVNITSVIGKNYIDMIQSLEWIEEAEEYLKSMLKSVLQVIESKRSMTTNDVVNEIITHIKDHYMDEMSLMQIAQQYHINYVHLSRTFKEKTGRTFTDYLLSTRMEKARELIEKYGYSERETGRLVGYSNPYYFLTSYRKYFGIEGE